MKGDEKGGACGMRERDRKSCFRFEWGKQKERDQVSWMGLKWIKMA